jgi:hypothetical protein
LHFLQGHRGRAAQFAFANEMAAASMRSCTRGVVSSLLKWSKFALMYCG